MNILNESYEISISISILNCEHPQTEHTAINGSGRAADREYLEGSREDAAERNAPTLFEVSNVPQLGTAPDVDTLPHQQSVMEFDDAGQTTLARVGGDQGSP